MTAELNPRFTFDTFVVGESNRLAVAAARTVAESPGTAYNPLFIYSATGLGKTHLVMAIGQLAKTVAPNITVEYLTLEEFIEALHAAVAAGHGEAFRNRFEGVDVILLDDVQFLTNRRETQAEMLRFITALLEGNQQIILTSDRPPNEIEHLDERLISRFAGGLVVDMAAPEYETRLAILKRKAEERGVTFEAAVLSAVAEIEARNVRELLGSLNRLIAFQAVSEAPLTPAGAQSLLAGEEAQFIGAPAAPAAPPPDEFAQFLSSVGTTVAQQMEAWHQRLREAMAFWEGQGYRVGRLAKLLNQDTPVGVDAVTREFEADVERLRGLEQEMATLDPARAGDPIFRDPELIADAEALVQSAKEGMTPPPGPSAAWAFDDFLAGESNRLALTSARAVAEQPGTEYNPLVIVGPTGVGKTHLLHGIGHALSAFPDALVACLSAQEFLDDLVNAIERDRVDAWRSKYRRASAFLLDDVQMLAGKDRSQEELFHLFNVFLDLQRQLVFTANAEPRQIEGLEERLVSRLDGGLVAEIAPPDRELRLGLIERALRQQIGSVDAELASYLADRPAGSLRAVIGTVQRVIEAAATQGLPATPAFARELLEGTPYRPRRSSTGMRTSGIVISPSGGIRSREKMVWYWPDIADRIVEDVA